MRTTKLLTRTASDYTNLRWERITVKAKANEIDLQVSNGVDEDRNLSRDDRGEASFPNRVASLTANICLQVDQHCILGCMEEGA